MKTISSKQISKSILLLLAIRPHEFVAIRGGLTFRVHHGWLVMVRPCDDSFCTFDLSMCYEQHHLKPHVKNFKNVPLEHLAWRIYRTVRQRSPYYLNHVGAWL